MTDQDFIDAILAEPDDDAPRLIYADWLEERGDPRAEFIRVQVEVANLARPAERRLMYGYSVTEPRERKDAARFRMLLERQTELLSRHCADWVEPLIGKARGVIFERGCVEGISARAEVFADHAAMWYRSMPIRQLCLSVAGRELIKHKDWRSLLASQHLLNIRTLQLGDGIRPSANQIAALARCPNVANVRELFFGYHRLDDPLLQKLRQSPYLKNARF